jgi:hypothetical protein
VKKIGNEWDDTYKVKLLLQAPAYPDVPPQKFYAFRENNATATKIAAHFAPSETTTYHCSVRRVIGVYYEFESSHNYNWKYEGPVIFALGLSGSLLLAYAVMSFILHEHRREKEAEKEAEKPAYKAPIELQ